MSRTPAALLLVVAALSLAACGMKSALELPPGPAPTPVLGKPRTNADKPAAADVSTPARQAAGTTTQ